MHIINNQQEFDNLCSKLPSEKIICIDTEFCRRNTYYAVLSLIQIATPKEKIIVDVLAGIDINPFKQILLNEGICKIFHAPDQDLDIFYHLFGKLPKNIFDTQVASSILGFGDMISYGRLCKAVLNVTLDKSMQKADWLQRPLSKKLLDYAIKDVEFLIPLHRNLSGALTARNLWDSYNKRAEKLLSPNSYKVNLDRLYKRAGVIDESDKFKEEFSHFIMLREECAQKFDIPRNRCASESLLLKLYENLPINDQQLDRLLEQRTYLTKQPFKTRLFELCSALR